MLNQRLDQRLLQKLSPQQIQLIKLLQVPTVALEQRIKQEIEENPALLDDTEEDENDEMDNEADEEELDLSEDSDNELDEPDTKDTDDDFDMDQYIDDDEIPSYKLNANNTSPDDEQREIPFSNGISFNEFLISQLGFGKLNERESIIALHIIGNIDDAGYLQREIPAMVNDIAFSQNIETTVEELNSILIFIQEFDPAGVGARNLQECLLLQLKRKEHIRKSTQVAIKIIEKFFDEFTRKHYDKILKKLGITDDDLKDAIHEILKLNPKPGNSLFETQKTSLYIVPDFFIYNSDGILELTINAKNSPDLKLNRTYTNMLEKYANTKGKQSEKDREAMHFVKQKLDSAKWFIDAVKQRHNTLYNTMKVIMDYQYDYFLTGDETKLKPMILKDIADIVSLDISTISRVVNSKYVQTSQGTFLLKTFFSESLSNDAGEEVSTREVKKILRDCVGNENKRKPITDDQLAVILREKGYHIARRTIAKYREQLSIPVARLRKEL